MKLFLIGALALICSTVNAAPNASILTLLEQMNAATKQLDYEIYYVRANKTSIEPMRYRHAVVGKERYAQLVYLSSPTRAMIRKANEVTYFEPGFDPYTLESEQIIAPLPVLSINFNRLMPHYNFVSLGRSREAGLPSQVIRISPKDNSRYSYVLWIDDKTKLLLRADLLDKNGELLEQTRSVKLSVSSNSKLAKQMQAELSAIKLPPALKLLDRNQAETEWIIDALPEGFLPITHNSYQLFKTNRVVENIMFSDGLFNFSIYFSKADEFSLREALVRNGRQTLFSQVKGNVEVVVVGEIPPDQAEKIIRSVRLKPTNKNHKSEK